MMNAEILPEVEIPIYCGQIAKSDLVARLFEGSKYQFYKAIEFALSELDPDGDEIKRLNWSHFKSKQLVTLPFVETLVDAAGLSVRLRPVKRKVKSNS